MPRINRVRPQAYGLEQALNELVAFPMIMQKDPTVNDWGELGQIAVNTANPAVFINVGNTLGDAIWLNLAGGSSEFDSITATTGNITALIGDIIANQGDIVAANGNIVAVGEISAATGEFDDVTLSSSLDVSGNVQFSALPDGVLITDNTGLVQAVQAANDGEILIGASGDAPVFALPTSTGMTIDITSPGPGQLNFERGGAAGISDFEADGPSNAQPLAGVIEFVGGSNINTSAATNVVTFNLNNDVTITGALSAGTTLSSTTTTTVGNALTVTTGNATITAGNLVLPATTSTAGQVTIGGNRWLHTYGTNNTFVGSNSGNFTLTGNNCVGIGQNVLTALTSGNANIGIGSSVLAANTTGGNNVIVGGGAMASGNASNTVAIGRSTLVACTGTGNTAIGFEAGINVTTGANNLLLGEGAGSAYTTESNNICIMNTGTVADADTIRIGNNTHTSCRIQGIYSRTVGGTNAAVLVDDTGLLGTAVSSARFKENIHDMGATSDALLKMRPVIFNYKANPDHLAYGLIAEEVNDVMPDLVNLDDEGLPHNVKYHDLPSLLLHQIQKLVARIDVLEAQLAGRK